MYLPSFSCDEFLVVSFRAPSCFLLTCLESEQLQLSQKCIFCSKNHSLKMPFCSVIHFFFPVVDFNADLFAQGLGEWLLLGPLWSLSTPSGETFCSSSLRIFRLSQLLAFSLIFILQLISCLFFNPMLIACVQPNVFAKKSSWLRGPLCLFEARAKSFLQMRLQHFSVRNSIPDNTFVMQVSSWQVLFLLYICLTLQVCVYRLTNTHSVLSTKTSISIFYCYFRFTFTSL